jgi:hypothetical protein
MGAPLQVVYSCHPEEAYRPTKDLLFDFFSSLFSRREICFYKSFSKPFAAGQPLEQFSRQRS